MQRPLTGSHQFLGHRDNHFEAGTGAAYLNTAEFLSVPPASITIRCGNVRIPHKSIFQVPPGKWLITKRLERAAVLLKDQKLNAAEMAYESGVKDRSHFGRALKE
jgi:AraC-like DNA-binding protein